MNEAWGLVWEKVEDWVRVVATEVKEQKVEWAEMDLIFSRHYRRFLG